MMFSIDKYSHAETQSLNVQNIIHIITKIEGNLIYQTTNYKKIKKLKGVSRIL